MMIGKVDIAVTKKINKSLKRKLRSQKPSNPKQIKTESKGGINTPTTSESTASEQDEVFQPYWRRKTVPSTPNPPKIDFKLLSQTCDRYGVSDRAGAAISSTILHSSSQVIDKNKLRRERKKTRSILTADSKAQQIFALFFDGRKDKTLTVTETNGKMYRKIISEEHVSLIMEPDSKFLGYIAPPVGTAKCIEEEINNFFLSSQTSLQLLQAIGCDGTNVNVGSSGGVIHLLEKRLKKPLQWIICLLHMNELPFRHLFQHIDGSTSGPNTFSGKIGKDLECCEKRVVVQFQPIPAQLPNISFESMSSDQKYLYEIVSAVSTGVFSEDLNNKSPGKMSHARWLTRANRILRLYVSTDTPSANLATLSEYIVKVYAPTWFAIKTEPTCQDGARHLYGLIAKSRYLLPELKAIIDRVIQRNGFFAHPENLLLAMITDPQLHVRELAVSRILEARCNHENKLRLFKIPTLNFNASSYIDLIDWNINITQPPILKLIPDDDIQLFTTKKDKPEINLLCLPCHTQAVERAVKSVTEASIKLSSKSGREGYIKAQMESRKIMPKFNSKKDFKAS